MHLNGIDLHYEECGAGPPLVLLHGHGGCTKTWRPFVPALAARYRLILVDLPGHGQSSHPKESFTHRAAAVDVFHLLDVLGVRHFSAMGLSSGGMVLLHMACSQFERIEAMVLVSATSHFPEQARAIMRAASFERMPPEVQTMYRECAARGAPQVRRLIEQFNALHANHDDMTFTAEELSRISARTLIVHGDRDRFFPTPIAEGLANTIPNAALWLIAGGEHVPIYEPGLPFVERSLEFLECPSTC